MRESARVRRGRRSRDRAARSRAQQALALARAESLTVLVNEERRITEERRRDVAERERDASAKLAETLNEAQRRVDQRLAGWGTDLEQLQESLAGELARIGQRATVFDVGSRGRRSTRRLSGCRVLSTNTAR